MKKLVFAALMAFGAPCFAGQTPNETKIAVLMDKMGPPVLRVFLTAMPKGGDLHNHLDGSVWAEDFLKWADQDGFCTDAASHALSPPPCSKAQIEAKGLLSRDPKFYAATIDALSVRNFVPGTGTGETSGHDHTFAAFSRFGAIMAGHLGDALAVTRVQGAADTVSYIEQITDPSAAFAPAVLSGIANFDAENFDADLSQIAPQMDALVDQARREYDAAEQHMHEALACGTPASPPGCEMKVRYLFFVLRTLPPGQMFAQTALGFALANADPRFVGVNLVGPEDDGVALRDFTLHMRIFQYFSRRFPKVKLSLHAGELWLGLVPPAALGFHIRDTVEVAGASRIGHGYEMPFERDAGSLLAEMARRHIAVEINLTSNDISPGVRGADHPLQLYRKAGVPFILSADDEGLFRIDLTHEYVRAVLEQHLRYPDLKTAARNGIEYSFLPGASLWRQTSAKSAGFARVSICATANATCAAFLKANEKAAAEAQLEQAFGRFEARALAGDFPSDGQMK